MRVLFLGREATPANNVPAQVEAIASALGGPCMTTDLIAIGPAAQGPSTAERVARRVSEGRWTHVVLLPIGPATEDIARAIDRRMPATTEMCKLSVRGAPFQARDVYEAIAETPAAIRPVDAKASTGMIWRMAPDSARRPAR